MAKNTYEFYLPDFSLETEEIKGAKQHFLTGHISTPDLDKVKDIVLPEAIDGMIKQLLGHNLKLDLDHELVKKGVTTPLGRIIEAKRDSTGALVKVLLNEAYPDFKNILYQLKNKFIDALSITFAKPQEGEYILQKGIRYLKKINLINVAATAYPANPNCSILSVFTKSLSEIEEKENLTKTKEVKKMPEQKEKESGGSESKDIATELAELKNRQTELETEIKELKAAPISARLDGITAEILERPEFKEIKTEMEKKINETEIEELKGIVGEIYEVLHAPQNLAIQQDVPKEMKGQTETKEVERASGPLDYI